MQKYESLAVFGCGLVYLAAIGVHAATTESKSGRGAVEVAGGRVSGVERAGGEAARETRE